MLAGAELGVYTTLGFAFQSIGLETTTASRSAFLLYLNVKFVPFLALLLLGRSISKSTWTSAFLALMGKGYLLNCAILRHIVLCFGVLWYSVLFCCVVLCCIELYCVSFYTALQFIALLSLYDSVVHCVAPYCTVLSCAVLRYIELWWNSVDWTVLNWIT